MLARLTYVRMAFTLRAEEPLRLPDFKGNTLRGALGYPLKALACPCGPVSLPDDPPSNHLPDCLYQALFRTHIEPGIAKDLRLGGADAKAPRPLIIEPPTTSRNRFQPGEHLSGRLVLIGRAVETWEIVLEALAVAAQNGLGTGRSRCRLVHVYDNNGTLLFDEFAGLRAEPKVQSINRPRIAHKLRQMTLHFITPTWLRPGGRTLTPADVQNAETLRTVTETLARRLYVLTQLFVCTHVTPLDHPLFPINYETVKLNRRATTLNRYTGWRESENQGRRIKTDGLVGRVVFTGVPDPVVALFRAGQPFHLGKDTIFGQGHYEVL
jgi:hypothetical protein